MPDPQPVLAAFKDRHPRLTGRLNQVVICVATFWCALTIARYGPIPIDDPASGASNATMERICKFGAREEEMDLGALTAITPYFMLCPSTATLIGACVIFVIGIGRLLYLNRHDIRQEVIIAMIILGTLNSIEWKKILSSLQTFLPLMIWLMTMINGLLHAFVRWAMPRYYARLLAQREEERRRWAEEEEKKRRAALPHDVELYGIPGEMRPFTEFEVGVDEDTR